MATTDGGTWRWWKHTQYSRSRGFKITHLEREAAWLVLSSCFWSRVDMKTQSSNVGVFVRIRPTANFSPDVVECLPDGQVAFFYFLDIWLLRCNDVTMRSQPEIKVRVTLNFRVHFFFKCLMIEQLASLSLKRAWTVMFPPRKHELNPHSLFLRGTGAIN